jgi:hypothetical protein
MVRGTQIFIKFAQNRYLHVNFLQPLLHPFLKNMNAFVFPHVGDIDTATLKSSLNESDHGPYNCGTFSWTMDYNWAQVKDFKANDNIDKWSPQKSVAAIGCVKL